MMRRILVSLALFLSIVFLPFWVYLPALVLAILLMPFYWEGIVAGFLIDSIYGAGSWLGAVPFPYALLALIMVLIVLPLRERIRFNA